MHIDYTSIKKDVKKLTRVLCFVFIFMLIELWGHWHSNSLSLLADSIHLFSDFLSFIIGIACLHWSKKQPTEQFNFGFLRVEIIGALTSIVFIYTTMIFLISKAYNRFLHPEAINEKSFVVVALVGFVFNLICLYFLREHSHNLNIKAAYIHILGDLIQSFGVLITSFLTFYYPKVVLLDTLCTACFSLIVICSTFNILKDIVYTLLESVPSDISYPEVYNKIRKIDGVETIEDLKIWALSGNSYASLVKIMSKLNSQEKLSTLKNEIRSTLESNKKITLINIEIVMWNSVGLN